MKAIKKNLFLKLFFCFFIAITMLLSCHDEAFEMAPPDDQETISASSNLANLISSTASFDGSQDNIIDGANCFGIELPVTVSINGVEIIIDSVEDYDVIEAIFDEFENDEDELEIIFPITIILSDYDEIVISNYDELNTFIDECLGENEDDDDIECIDFQYPISFSIYDAAFQVIDTVVIENDEALYNFIEDIEDGVLTSLNFPVTMILSDGSTVEVNNNQELEEVIAEAEDDCDEDDDYDYNDDDVLCSQQDIEAYLFGCSQVLTLNEYAPSFTTFSFNDDNALSTLFENDQPASGTWDIVVNDESVFVVINFSPPTFSFLENITGTWKVVECTENYLVLEQGDDVLIIESVCENPCYSGSAELVECGVSGFATFDLTTAFGGCDLSTILFYVSTIDAENGTNPLASPETYTNVVNPQTIYVPIPAPFGAVTLYEVELIVENCNETCSELTVDDYLQTCTWSVVNLNGSNDLINYDLDFNNDETVLITGNGQTITGMWSTSETAEGVSVEFDGIDGADIQAITGTWFLVECDPDRLQFGDSTQIMVLEQDCNNDGVCNESEVDAILMECEWQIALYNGSAGFNIFYIDFLDDQAMTIASASESYSGNWTSSQDGDFVYVEFSNISGGNVQVFNGINFKVVECTTEQMILHDVNDGSSELVLERICN